MKQPLSYCVIPAAVKKKLTMAKKKRQTVYLYGPAGFGKTLVVREFLKICEAKALASHLVHQPLIGGILQAAKPGTL